MKKPAGFTLIEMVVALSILSALVFGTTFLINQSSEDTRAAAAAQHLKTFGDTANLAIRDNYAALLTAVPVGGAPTVFNSANAILAVLLPPGYSPTNAFNQTICVLVSQPTAGNLTALVVTEGGDVILDGALAGLVPLAGASAGGIYTNATAANPNPATTVMGAMNGWSIPIGNFANAITHCDGTVGAIAITAGHPAMALWFVNSNSTAGFLYRDAIPNRPELNTMTTPLVMNSVQVVGAGCVAGAIARDNAGGLLSCDVATLLWKAAGGSQFWQDPVATLANLPACNLAAKGQTRVVETPAMGTGPRAYTCDGVSAWKALALDDGGNITIPGTATIAALNGNLQITATAAVNTACTGEGRLATSTSTSGLILSCQNSVWKTAQGAIGVVGGWVFKINTPYSGPHAEWYQGYGAYNSSTSTFSGQLGCDPMTYVACNAYPGGTHWSGSNAADAYLWAKVLAAPVRVGVDSLPVFAVTQRW